MIQMISNKSKIVNSSLIMSPTNKLAPNIASLYTPTVHVTWAKQITKDKATDTEYSTTQTVKLHTKVNGSMATSMEKVNFLIHTSFTWTHLTTSKIWLKLTSIWKSLKDISGMILSKAMVNSSCRMMRFIMDSFVKICLMERGSSIARMVVW